MFLFVLLLGLMFLVGIYLINQDLATAGWCWLAISVGIGIAVYEVPRFQFRRSMRRNPSFQGEIVLLLNDKGIDSTFATGKSQLQWRAFTKYKETGHVFVLSMSRTRGIFIPKRVMSPQQIEELRSLLKAQIPSKVTTSQPN
jgi:hypothetical protein